MLPNKSSINSTMRVYYTVGAVAVLAAAQRVARSISTGNNIGFQQIDFPRSSGANANLSLDVIYFYYCCRIRIKS